MDSTHSARVAQVQQWAVKYGLDSALVCAVIEQESSWNPVAVRWEPAFYKRYIVPMNLVDETEAICRAISWGYMQVMGETAREHKFSAQFLSQICDPDTGIDIGCQVLKSKIDGENGDVSAGLQRYNGGGNADYASQVLARVSSYQEG
jgi:soluble lytic murein transglycosylase-like protein